MVEAAAAFLLLTGLAVCWRAFFYEPAAFEAHEVEVAVPGLSEAHDGVRIAHLTDLHLRGFGEAERRWLKALRAARPDLIALTGDLLHKQDRLPFLAPALAELAQAAPVFAVWGDNDHHSPSLRRALEEELRRAGARLLRNEWAAPAVRGEPLCIAGVDDPHTGRARLSEALAGARRPVLLLAHSPEIFPEAAEAVVALTLAGHTHGGQICLPGGVALWTQTRRPRYASGLFRSGASQLYVSRGLGTAKIRARLFCRPELPVLRLRRSQAH